MKSPGPNPLPPTRFGEIDLPHLEAPNSDALGDWLRRMDVGAGLTGLATVKRLRAAGALIVGKTNTPEFGCTGATDNPLFGATVNAWNTAYSAGGSSGGSGAALAAGLVPLATGSDGGGSIRVPVSACGFPGFKPSTGRIPSGDANPPTGRPLSVRGPMARTIRDTVIALNVVKGDAATDIFALPDGPTDWLAAWSAGTRPDRMIWAPSMGFADVDANARKVCEAAIESLRHAGVTVIEHDRIIVEHPLARWWTLRTAGLACTLGDRIGTEDFARIDPPLQHMIQVGMKVTGRDYAQALDACHRFNYQLEQAFALAPVILGPTCVGRVPRSGKGGLVNGRETEDWVQRTFGLNLSRNPAATVYAECNEDGLPVGLQVIGRQRRDLDTLIAAGAIEQILGGPEQPG